MRRLGGSRGRGLRLRREARRLVFHTRYWGRLSIRGWCSWEMCGRYTILVWWICCPIWSHGVVVIIGICVSRILLLVLLVPLIVLLLLLDSSRVTHCWLKLTCLCCSPTGLCGLGRVLTFTNGG